jgi:hypothetical protein
MKKLLPSVILLCITFITYAQKDPVADFFDKYAGKEGVSYVIISGKMFSMFEKLDNEKDDADDIMNRLDGIRILTVEDTVLNRDLNFYEELGENVDYSVYEELMVIKEASSTTKFLINQKGERFYELLIISGGSDGNSLISIKGDLDIESLSDLYENVGIEELESLE